MKIKDTDSVICWSDLMIHSITGGTKKSRMEIAKSLSDMKKKGYEIVPGKEIKKPDEIENR